MLRKFQNVGGFTDGTKYVVYDTTNGEFYLEMKDGLVNMPMQDYHLNECLKFVAKGDWEEIKECNCTGNSLKGCEEKLDELSCSDEDKRETFESLFKDIFKDIAEATGLPVSMVKPSLPPIDFSTAQVGDTVRCLLNGDIEVTAKDHEGDLWHENQWYSQNGHLEDGHKNPCLIGWVDSDGNLCRTRPEPKIDWSKVPIDAPVAVTLNGIKETSHFAGEIGELTDSPRFWCDGRTSHTTTLKQSARNAKYKLINTREK